MDRTPQDSDDSIDWSRDDALSGVGSAPRCPLPKPDRGRYHLIRFIRSDGMLDVFGERFALPQEAVYEYAVATVDAGKQELSVTIAGTTIEEYDYRVRRAAARQVV